MHAMGDGPRSILHMLESMRLASDLSLITSASDLSAGSAAIFLSQCVAIATGGVVIT